MYTQGSAIKEQLDQNKKQHLSTSKCTCLHQNGTKHDQVLGLYTICTLKYIHANHTEKLW